MGLFVNSRARCYLLPAGERPRQRLGTTEGILERPLDQPARFKQDASLCIVIPFYCARYAKSTRTRSSAW